MVRLPFLFAKPDRFLQIPITLEEQADGNP